jgi:FlaA1/EpsC-like NDP-sugar epimerase
VRSFFNFYEAMIIFSRKHLELRALPLFFLHVGVAALALANFLSRRFRRWRRWLADLAIVNGALAGVTMTYQYFLGGDFLLITHGGLRWFWHSLASLAVLLPMAYIGEYGRAFVPFRAVFLTACGSFLGFFALSYFIQERAYSRVAFALTAVFGVSMMLGWRSLVLRERIWRKIPGLRRRIAILGAGERARETARLVEARPAEFASAEFVGFVPFPPGSATLEMRDRILGDLDSLRGMARKLDLHVLIVALDESAHSAALQALSRQGTGPMEVKLLVGRPDPGEYSLVNLDFRK